MLQGRVWQWRARSLGAPPGTGVASASAALAAGPGASVAGPTLEGLHGVHVLVEPHDQGGVGDVARAVDDAAAALVGHEADGEVAVEAALDAGVVVGGAGATLPAGLPAGGPPARVARLYLAADLLVALLAQPVEQVYGAPLAGSGVPLAPVEGVAALAGDNRVYGHAGIHDALEGGQTLGEVVLAHGQQRHAHEGGEGRRVALEHRVLAARLDPRGLGAQGRLDGPCADRAPTLR